MSLPVYPITPLNKLSERIGGVIETNAWGCQFAPSLDLPRLYRL